MTTTIEDMYKQIVGLNKIFPLDFTVRHGVMYLDAIKHYVEDIKIPPRYFEQRNQFKQVIMKELERVVEIEGEESNEVLELQRMLESSEFEKLLVETHIPSPFPPSGGPLPPLPENMPPPPLVPPTNGVHNLNLTTDLPIASGCIEDAKKIAESRIARNVTKTSQEVKTGYIEMENPNQNRETTKEQI